MRSRRSSSTTTITWQSLSLYFLPVHRDAKDPLLGGEDLGHHVFAPVGAVLGDDDGLVDVCEGKQQPRSPKVHQPSRPLDLHRDLLTTTPLGESSEMFVLQPSGAFVTALECLFSCSNFHFQRRLRATGQCQAFLFRRFHPQVFAALPLTSDTWMGSSLQKAPCPLLALYILSSKQLYTTPNSSCKQKSVTKEARMHFPAA